VASAPLKGGLQTKHRRYNENGRSASAFYCAYPPGEG
jgi:hypothetical protein